MPSGKPGSGTAATTVESPRPCAETGVGVRLSISSPAVSSSDRRNVMWQLLRGALASPGLDQTVCEFYSSCLLAFRRRDGGLQVAEIVISLNARVRSQKSNCAETERPLGLPAQVEPPQDDRFEHL